MVEFSPTSSSNPAPSQPLCKVCNSRYAIYTCPRCKIRTCSLPCSASHKSATNCSGERDKVGFVNMRDYNWGTMMSDYTYLEDVGRRVTEWGATIVKGAYTIPQTGRDAQGIRGRGGRGQPRGRGGRGTSYPKTKRDILKTQLETQNISMDLLPLGMERRQHNQSTWNFKNQSAYLTIEFKFLPPQDSTTSKQMPSFSLLTHRNDIKIPLLTLVASHIREHINGERKRERGRGKKKAAYADEHATENSVMPAWLLELVEEISTSDSEISTLSPFDCLIRAPVPPIPPTALSITGTRSKAAYHRILPTEPLVTALRNTHFVEYPTLELWPQGEFSGIIADQHIEPEQCSASGFGKQLVYERGDLSPADDSGKKAERRAKRRKIELKAGKKAISGMLGEYGSEDESGQEEGKADNDGQAQNGLMMLGGYEDSDEDNKIEMGSDEDEDGVEVRPEVLLELMRKAQGISSWLYDPKDDERVDWGDEGSEDGDEE